MKTQKILIMVLFIALGWTGGIQAEEDCGDRQKPGAFNAFRLRGTYGGVVFGTRGIGSPTGPEPFAALLVLTFDGVGGFSGTNNSSLNGFITGPFPLSGTYHVNADGTGSLVAVM